MTTASALHQNAIFFDGLNCCNWDREIFEDMRKGGITAINCAALVWENLEGGLRYVLDWKQRIRDHADLLRPVHSVADIHAAKAENKTGIILGWQNTSPIEDQLGYVEIFRDLGVRFMQLTYNTQNYSGAGYLEPNDSGLTGFGREVIEEMARVGVVCDLSHVGDRTSADVIAHSPRPVCFSHVLPRALKNVGRNKPDALMKACADRGGLVGVCLFSPGLAAGNDATIEDYIDAMEHVLALVGEEHVGIGLDFSLKHARPGPYQTFASRDKGYARSLTPYATAKVEKPKGIQQLHEAPNITEAMARRGWKPARIEKILGQNWLRLVGEVWK